MAVTITTLVENTIATGVLPVIAEHGLAFLIESDNRKILFDTGQGLAILNNADAMDIDLSDVDTVILSHGHFDHARGLKPLLTRNTNFTMVAHPDVFDRKLAGTFPIGISQDRAMIESSGIKIKLESDPVDVAPGIRTTGNIAMETDFEMVEPMFFTMQGENRVPDSIPDDKALILDTRKGTVVVLGCAHRGLINTLNHVAEVTGEKKIHAIIGGLHLFMADDTKLQRIFKYLKAYDVEKMIVGHCTGFHAIAALYQEFGSKVVPNVVGYKEQF